MEYRVKSNKRVHPIPGFPGYYISKSGDVWSEKHEKFLKPIVHYCGEYKLVNLSIRSEIYQKLIHRLVLETFIGPCLDGMEACHNNGDPADNRIENLRWDTHSNNMKDSVRHGTHYIPNNRGENHPRVKLNALQVRVIRRLLEFKTLTQKEIGNVFKVSLYTVSDIKRRKSWRDV